MEYDNGYFQNAEFMRRANGLGAAQNYDAALVAVMQAVAARSGS
jgi:hypothetical protein